MTRFARMPSSISATEYGPISTARIGAPDGKAEEFAEAPCKSAFASAGIADQQQWAEVDSPASNEIGKSELNNSVSSKAPDSSSASQSLAMARGPGLTMRGR